MYLEHYGLAEAPFRITPHTDFFFAGANRGATLEALVYAITHDEGIVKVSGEVGSGKTMLCRVLMERLPDNIVIIYLANPSLSRDDILYALADELGIAIPEQSRTNTVMRALQETLVALYAEGKQVVVLIDEAHAMPKETLEEIRLLSNLESSRHKLLQLVLFGQPEINEILARPDMRQLRERITHNFFLEPLVRDDIAQYLDFRMRAAGYRGPSVFAPAAIKLIADASQGLTRRINILADKALLATFAAGGHQIGTREAKAAIKDSEFSHTAQANKSGVASAPAWISAGGGAIAMLAIMLAWRPGQPSATEAATQTALPAQARPLAAPRHAPPPIAAPPLMESKPLPPPHTPETTPSADNTTAAAASQPAASSPPAETPTPQLDKLLAESKPWLAAVPQNRWFLQLLTVDGTQPDKVEAFLTMARSAGVAMAKIRIYHSPLSGTARYGVILGDYVSRKDAVNDLGNLPPALKIYHPYARQAIRLR